MQQWLATEAISGGPPVRLILPKGPCRTLFPVLQDCAGFTLTQLPVGGTASGSQRVTQTWAGGDLGRLQSEGVPLGDDRWQVDVQIQGGANARAALIIKDGCGCG
jgi:hypothetical protein